MTRLQQLNKHTGISVGRDSSVGIVTRHGLKGMEIDAGEARFSAPTQTGPGAHQASDKMAYRVSFPG